MTCKSCSSKNREAFSAEINVHFGGWEGLKKPGVSGIPKASRLLGLWFRGICCSRNRVGETCKRICEGESLKTEG